MENPKKNPFNLPRFTALTKNDSTILNIFFSLLDKSAAESEGLVISDENDVDVSYPFKKDEIKRHNRKFLLWCRHIK